MTTHHNDECLRCRWRDTERRLGAAVYESITVGIGKGKPAENLHRWLDLYARRMAAVIEEAGVLAFALEDDREPTP